MVYNQKCYKFDLEGLARYASDLNFKVGLDLYFRDNLMERVDRAGSNYTQYITNYSIEFTPVFSSFYSDNKCIIKLLVPATSIIFNVNYLNSIASCKFKIDNLLNESFLNIEIDKEDLNNFSIDFNEVNKLILDKINNYCDSQLRRLKHGLWDENRKWYISCDCTFSQVYAQFS